jgi:hypothetical protein
MTVAEMLSIAQGDAANAMTINETALVALTSYLLIAYFIGANLTFFQVSFVNVVFLLARAAMYFSLLGVMTRVEYFNQIIVEADPSIPMGTLGAGGGSLLASVIYVLLTLGALVFMWQVRHPRSE